jgi:hypothetical protein
MLDAVNAVANVRSPLLAPHTESPPRVQPPRTDARSADTQAAWRAVEQSCVPESVSSGENFRPVPVEHGPNDFRLFVDGPNPTLAVGGSHDQQELQRDKTVTLTTLAIASYASGHAGLPRVPNDGQVEHILTQLKPNPPIGSDGVEVTHAVYASDIPNATPEQVYRHFVDRPGEVFNAGGMEIRPPSGRLEDGGRYMLEIDNPPTWLPIEVRLDDVNRTVTINTLDGHVLRGEQTFSFVDNCRGGVTIVQDAHFQASSELVGDAQQFASVSAGQHRTWQFAHREIYAEFNGDPGYQGMGIHAFNREQLRVAVEGLKSIVRDPGGAADAGIDIAGELSNWGIDLTGRLADRGIDGLGGLLGDRLDRLGLPGGGVVRGASDRVGDGVSWAADKTGDGVSWVADKAGDGAKKVIGALNPFD